MEKIHQWESSSTNKKDMLFLLEDDYIWGTDKEVHVRRISTNGTMRKQSCLGCFELKAVHLVYLTKPAKACSCNCLLIQLMGRDLTHWRYISKTASLFHKIDLFYENTLMKISVIFTSSSLNIGKMYRKVR